MSFSNPELTNPAKHFFEWKGGEGKLQFYDKEKKENVIVPLPFEFIPIDQLATITGHSKLAKSNYYSNEVRSTVKNEFVIKLKGQTVFTGLYKNDQGIAQVPKGAGFTASIYIVHKTKSGEYIMGNIKANGSALSAWIEFSKNKIVGNGKAVMTKGAMQTSAVGDFYPPEFKYEHLTPEDFKAAMEADKELQIYLNQYLSAPKAEEHDTNVDQTIGLATPEQLADYEERKKAKLDTSPDPMAAVHANNPMNEDPIYEVGEEPVNLDDIPF